MLRYIYIRLDQAMMLLGLWLADILPSIFKPLKMWVGNRMTLACGYCNRYGQGILIYRPARNSRAHQLVEAKKANIKNKFRQSTAMQYDLYDTTMKYCLLNRAKSYHVIKSRKRLFNVYSKVVESKKGNTVFNQNSLQVQVGNPKTVFSWRNPKDKDFWFSFLTIEDEDACLVAGIYTRQQAWRFGDFASLPYFVKATPLKKLAKDKVYQATLYSVDRYNWVTHLHCLTFQV